MNILIVGAGFTGAVIARYMAEKGHSITVIDKRNHIGGNCFDKVIGDNMVHMYGPHLMHHNDDEVHEFLMKHAKWKKYEHKVKANIDGKLISFPVNLKTLNQLYGIETEQEAIEYFEKNRSKKIPENCDELFDYSVGTELADMFFRPYTEKMWGTSPKNISCSVGARIPVRTNNDDRYFSDKYQYLPVGGYTMLFESILNHKNISVWVNTAFNKELESKYDLIFNSMAIDSYYDYCFGKLPYRSLEMVTVHEEYEHNIATVNNSASYENETRYTVWKNLPLHGMGDLVTYEYPCEYNGTNEPYYPVTHGKDLYERYKQHHEGNDKVIFIGRMGTYQYIDMWKAIKNGIDLSKKY